MIKASCHCGAIALTLKEAPSEVTDYSLSNVTINGGMTDKYLWNDRSISFNRCKICGCVTHWWPETRSDDRMGVNARLLDLAILEAARVRHLDGAVSERYLD
jgi:hypothetical protein